MKLQQHICAGKCFYGLLSVLVLLTSASCKKSSGKEEDGDLTQNSFSFDGKTFKDAVVYYNANDAALKATHSVPGTPFNTVNSVSITFSDDKMPETGGTFNIVNDPYSPGNTANNNEISITFSSFPYNYGSYYDYKRYAAKLEPKQTATVSVDGNKKVSVRFSNIILTNNIDATTTTASGYIVQP